MANRLGTGALVGIGVLLIASVGAMAWVWSNGGVTLAPSTPMQEACNVTITGSSAMTPRLAPQLASAFLTRGGYQVSEPTQESDGAVKIAGVLGAAQCTITVRPSTSTAGFRELARPGAVIALAQRPITQPEIDALRDSGAGDFAAERIQAEHVIAFDAYGVVVNAANPVREIRYDHLRDVVFGRIANWTQLGGADAPLSPYAMRDGTAAEDYPNDLVHQRNQDWIDALARARVVDSEADAVPLIANDPNALAFMSVAYVEGAPQLRALAISFGGPAQAATPANVLAERYPMARRMFAYVRPDSMRDNPFVQSFIAYITSPEAFDLIDAAGFGALRASSRLSGAANSLSGCTFGTAEYAALASATRGAEHMPGELHFLPNTTDLDVSARRFVADNTPALRQSLAEGGRVILIGHTDYTGDVAKNRELALRRALAARAAFEARGVFGIEVESAGEVCPRADNQSEEGRELNRRVEVWLKPPTTAP